MNIERKPDHADTPACPDEGTDDCTPKLSQDSANDGDSPKAFDELSELVWAIEEAKSSPPTRVWPIMADLAGYYSRLPASRQRQLAGAGYRGKSDGPDKLVQLVAMALLLAAIKHDGVFHLGYAEAARAMHVSKSWAWAWLRLLESAGVLVCVERGNWRRGLSTTYKFRAITNNGDGADGGQLPF